MKLSEIFASIQGEGPLNGVPSVFVRLSGCNLRCQWCDTKHAWENSTNISPEKIAEVIKKYGLSYGVITGGEPLLQSESIPKIIGLLPNMHWTIETNGTLPPVDGVSLYCVSPKLQHIKVEVLREYRGLDNAVFKFVVTGDNKEFMQIRRLCADLDIPQDRRYLMAEGASLEKQKLKAELLVHLCHVYNFRYSPRLQSLLFEGERYR